ncbi:MAG TPA: GNAT family N-acetyltransferase [Candidatus Lachnoclostridium pullistercoris]|uniref:GNAT family N-acetyltransferase n=1 Tax=Candidatus Lachnoclostridium pullistercoris TaxID=2838632 RepID=A0A9D2PBQ1_9FIRM|nr:GNAT family N-acetyltransferase [Candidatus Lachnoclostridium pullistercoris]
MKEFVIAEGRKEDIPEILEVMRGAEAGLPCRDWYVTDGEEFFEAHMGEEGFVLTARDGESSRLAGFLAVRIPGLAEDNLGRFLGLEEEELKKTAHMESAAVAPLFRGNGLQGRMMAEAERMLKERGFDRLMGTVHPENRYSRNHFLRLGYRTAARARMYGGLPREIMEKEIERF